MDATGSRDLKLWFADGTNYPGQDDIRARQDRLAEALAAVYDRLGADQRMLLEYKLFEPAFYTTDVPDWGTALRALPGARASRRRWCVDTGHHAPGTNIEFIVAFLLRAGKLGGFDFNSRFYADDDLMVGAADPFQLFRIMHEVVPAGGARPDGRDRVHARPVPQHRAEDPGADPLGDERPGGHRQGAARRPPTRWPRRSSAGDVLGANAVLMDAYNTDVRPLLAELRADMGLDPDPIAAYQPVRLRREDRRRARRRHAGRLGQRDATQNRPAED